MTPARLLPMLLLALAGGASVGGAVLAARWTEAARSATVQTDALRDATRRTRELVARAEVRLALERARLTPYDSAPVHLVVSRADGRLTLGRGPVILRRAALVTAASIGLDRVVAVGAAGVDLADAGRLDAAAGLTPADLAVLRRLVRPGVVVYVL